MEKQDIEYAEIMSAIHYLKLLQKSYSYFQPEMRASIDLAIKKLQDS